ncbi:MAG: TRAP transporter substrate-binding protein DctP [Bacillota bacterium]
MKKRLFMVFLLSIVLLCFAITGCAKSPPSPPQNDQAGDGSVVDSKVYKWDFFTYFSSASTNAKFYNGFIADVKEKSNGRLLITLRTEGEVPYSATEALQIIANNSVQIADCDTGYISGDIPEMQVITGLPFLNKNQQDFLAIDKALRPTLQNKLDKYNAKPLFIYNMPQQVVSGKGKTVNSYSEMANKKIRTYSPVHQEFLAKFNISPISMTLNEVPSAIQRGVIDGIVTSSLSITDYVLEEICDWTYMKPLSIACNYIVVNQSALAELPEDLREIVIAAAAKCEAELRQQMDEIEQSCFEKMKDAGMELYYPNAEDQINEDKVAAEFWESWGQKQSPEVRKALAIAREAVGK